MNGSQRFWIWFFSTRLGAWMGRDRYPTTEEGWERWQRRYRWMYRGGALILWGNGIGTNLTPGSFTTLAGRIATSAFLALGGIFVWWVSAVNGPELRQRVEAVRSMEEEGGSRS